MPARRDHGGSWRIETWERGVVRRVHTAADWVGMCGYLHEFSREHAFPFGWHVPDGWAAVVEPGLDEVRTWWAEHSALPYIAKHQPTGSAARVENSAESG